jgi:hypothetical protein
MEAQDQCAVCGHEPVNDAERHKMLQLLEDKIEALTST